MGQVLPVPRAGDIFADVRDGDRTMRVSWHAEAGEVGEIVVSLWAGQRCRASFRLPAADVPRLIDTLALALPDETAAPPAAGAATPEAPISPAA